MIDRKGILTFLAITFGTTYLVEGILILSGFRFDGIPAIIGQYVVAAAMWIPAVAALITIRFVTHEKVRSLNLRFGPSWKPYLATALLIPLTFAVTYAITWLLGLGRPDWQITSFLATIAATGVDMSTAPAPGVLLGALFAISFLAAPFLNSLFGLGEEVGWRGFLLPRLMPLGKWKAYLLLGLIWGLWHAPIILVGFNYPGSPVLGIIMMILLTTAIGFYINELALRYQSAILAGWVHGVFNSQSYGIWRSLLFANTNPFLGGITGLVGIVVLTTVGLLTMRWVKRHETPTPMLNAKPAISPL
ncbi:MAG TPA: CPBP family glutamic-type intramembrane protease [Anaerolineaceae bacterium]